VFRYLDKNFIFTDYISKVDTGSGIIYQSEQNASLTSPNYFPVGVVDYTTGLVNINQTTFSNLYGGLKIIATPEYKDIYCKGNIIIKIDTISGISLETVSE
jgi:hypothetical protein